MTEMTSFLYGAGGIVAGIIAGTIFQKMRKASAGQLAAKIREDAEKEAAHIQREAKVTAKAEFLKMRAELEEELDERRKEQFNIEKRLNQREETLQGRADTLDKRFSDLERKDKDIDALRDRLKSREKDLQDSISKQIDELERIALMDRETAKKLFLTNSKMRLKTSQESWCVMFWKKLRKRLKKNRAVF